MTGLAIPRASFRFAQLPRRLRQQRPQRLLQFLKRRLRGASRDQHQVHSSRQPIARQAICLTIQPAESIPHHRPAHLARHRQADAVVLAAVLAGVNDEPLVADRALAVVDPPELTREPQMLAWSKALVAHRHGTSARGSCGFSFANSSANSRLRSSMFLGTTTFNTTYRSPPATPWRFRRSFEPLEVPGGTVTVTLLPSSSGASTFAPSTASGIEIGTSTSRSSPSRRKYGCESMCSFSFRLAPPPSTPLSRSACPSFAPDGTLTLTSRPSISRSSFPPRAAVRKGIVISRSISCGSAWRALRRLRVPAPPNGPNSTLNSSPPPNPPIPICRRMSCRSSAFIFPPKPLNPPKPDPRAPSAEPKRSKFERFAGSLRTS